MRPISKLAALHQHTAEPRRRSRGRPVRTDCPPRRYVKVPLTEDVIEAFEREAKERYPKLQRMRSEVMAEVLTLAALARKGKE